MKISKAMINFIWVVIICGFAISIFSEPVGDYLREDPIRITIAAVGLLFLAFPSWYIYSARNREELLSQYELFKEAHKLEPEDLGFQRIEPGEPLKPGFRPYYDTYIPRKAVLYKEDVEET